MPLLASAWKRVGVISLPGFEPFKALKGTTRTKEYFPDLRRTYGGFEGPEALSTHTEAETEPLV